MGGISFLFPSPFAPQIEKRKKKSFTDCITRKKQNRESESENAKRDSATIAKTC